jgi:hypothetical protein
MISGKACSWSNGCQQCTWADLIAEGSRLKDQAGQLKKGSLIATRALYGGDLVGTSKASEEGRRTGRNGEWRRTKDGKKWRMTKEEGREEMTKDEWRMKNEEWRMKNEEWRMKNEEWRMKNAND